MQKTTSRAKKFQGKKVLVVGCGNSGMEVSLDLSNHNAKPSMVIRNSVHVLPREMFGKIHIRFSHDADEMVTSMDSPLTLKNHHGKTPVLDIGALEKIRSGDITVVPGIKKFTGKTVELVNGDILNIDSVVLATGYFSNVPFWLHESEFFAENGFPKTPFPNGWKGKGGLYAAGFTRRGLAGASADAMKISKDIGKEWKAELKQKKQKVPTHRRCISTF
ncbi:unnamed protein product [Lactuca virosa]|uniref:indole-3-pyruvate monooxygenase n=1 Tax=Lactuca virosa TaxID=75947 RepID=A0AAU9M780_9ASTR|nr:unnamed protein product [Lactuca virosa]